MAESNKPLPRVRSSHSYACKNTHSAPFVNYKDDMLYAHQASYSRLEHDLSPALYRISSRRIIARYTVRRISNDTFADFMLCIILVTAR